MASMMAYQSANNAAVPDFLNKGDNAWQLTAATLVGMQSVPGLVILYGSMVKKKWAVNSAMMALYAYAMALVCWVMWGYKMSFGRQAMPILGIPEPAMTFGGLQKQAVFPAQNLPSASQIFFPEATMVYFQFVFAAISIILVAGSLLARMSFTAWAIFVPAWITLSYTVGAFSVWGGGFLYKMGVLDFSGGYVIHLSSGVAGFTAAYWVGPRLTADRVRFPPNNLILMLAGAGLVWGGWAGFNGGGPFAASTVASLAVLNTNVAAATSLLVWCALDAAVLGKPSSFGAVQGMVTGLVAITPGAGVVEPWGALLMGVASGSLPWFTMTVLHHRVPLLQLVDDTMGVFHTHAVAGSLGGLLTGVFATPVLCDLFAFRGHKSRGLLYGGHIVQVGRQLAAALFIIAWNVVVTSLIMLAIRAFTPLRMSDDLLRQGDEAVHGEEAFAFYDDLDDQQAGNNDKLDASL